MAITLVERALVEKPTPVGLATAHTAFLVFRMLGTMTCRLHCGRFYLQAQSTGEANNDWHGVYLSLQSGSGYEYGYFDYEFATEEFRELATYTVRLGADRSLTVRRNGLYRGSTIIEDIPEAYWLAPRMGAAILSGALAEEGQLEMQTMLHFATALSDDDCLIIESMLRRYR